MGQTEFPIGSICRFLFGGLDFTVEVVGDFNLAPSCVLVSPEDSVARNGLAYPTTVNGRFAFATSIRNLKMLSLPQEDGDIDFDISNLI